MPQHQQKFWPKEWVKGMIKTQNQMGVMTTELAPVSQMFAQFAKSCSKPVLDIGCAYGAATLPALANGAKVIACDLEAKHLEILAASVPDQHKPQLTTTTKAFPDALGFPNESLSAVHMSMVLHFLKGEACVAGLKKCYQWLEHGGKVFIVNMTPSLGLYKWKELSAEYNRRIETGHVWPGEILQRPFAREGWSQQLPEFAHFFQRDTMEKLARLSGFTVETLEYFTHQNVPQDYKTNGREWIGMVAVKD